MSDKAALVLILAAGEWGRRRRRGSSSQHLDMAPDPDYSLAKETGSLYTRSRCRVCHVPRPGPGCVAECPILLRLPLFREVEGGGPG